MPHLGVQSHEGGHKEDSRCSAEVKNEKKAVEVGQGEDTGSKCGKGPC
jgi:hypothetical protein